MTKRSRRSSNNANNQISGSDIAAIVRREIERAQLPKGAQVSADSPAAVYRPIPNSIISQMQMHLGPQKNVQDYFAPGAPIPPVEGITPPDGPRQNNYIVGYNTSQMPRSTEQYSFSDLRDLANLYYGIQLCEQVLLDYVTRLELLIEPIPELLGEDDDASKFDSDIKYYKDFFSFPDKERDLRSWLRMAVRDVLEVDALSIYVHPNRAGGVWALEIIDSTTIKPLITDRGKRPLPPYPSYQQFLYGVPVFEATSDDMLYLKETERSESVYGMSRVEKIMMIVNTALRKGNKDLTRFTDGTVPSGVLELPMELNWTQDQIESYELQFNNLLAGNDQMRARIKALPRGMTFKPTDPPEINTEFDRWLLNVTAACFGLTMAELGITESVNKSSGESQENVVYRRALGPLMSKLADLFTHILRKYFHEDRFIVRWKGFEESEDLASQAVAYSTLTNAGIISPTRAARLLHLPVDGPDLPSAILTTPAGPQLIEDFADPKMRKMQNDAKTAGLQLAIQNPGQKPQGQNDPGNPQEKQETSSAEKSNEEDDSGKKPSETPLNAKQDDRSIGVEYKRWREVALRDVKSGKAIRKFQSSIIPNSTLAMGHVALQRCSTATDVRDFFDAIRSTHD